MLNKNRKGVSEVVANVLIVLLVIVGIAVIWSVVKPTIDKGAQGIQTGSECLSISLEPVSCAYTNATNVATSSASAKIKRNSGGGSIDSIDVVFEGTGGTSKVYTYTIPTTGFDELSTVDVTPVWADVSGLTEPVTVNVAARTGGQLCPLLSQPVTCA